MIEYKGELLPNWQANMRSREDAELERMKPRPYVPSPPPSPRAPESDSYNSFPLFLAYGAMTAITLSQLWSN